MDRIDKQWLRCVIDNDEESEFWVKDSLNGMDEALGDNMICFEETFHWYRESEINPEWVKWKCKDFLNRVFTMFVPEQLVYKKYFHLKDKGFTVYSKRVSFNIAREQYEVKEIYDKYEHDEVDRW